MDSETQQGRFAEWQVHAFLEQVPRTGQALRWLRANVSAIPNRQKQSSAKPHPEKEKWR